MGGGTILWIVTSLLPTVVFWKALKRDSESTALFLAVDFELLLLGVVAIVVVMVFEKTRTVVGVM